MTQITDLMRTAAAEPPPTGIDLDALIAGEQRRSRRLRWTRSLAAGAVVIAALVASPLLSRTGGSDPAQPLDQPAASPGRPAVCPTVTPPSDGRPRTQQSPPAPRPTESCTAAVKRLTTELTAALNAAEPGLKITPSGSTVFLYNTLRVQYEAALTLTGPTGSGAFSIRIVAAHDNPQQAKTQCSVPSDQPCLYRVTPDGTAVAATDGDGTRQAVAFRTDGTAILAGIRGTDGAKPVLTQEQLATIAAGPGLTLFPFG